ncbi:MAG: hypothetical protein ACREQJ_08575 [Candidatus Binatia bacterium]
MRTSSILTILIGAIGAFALALDAVHRRNRRRRRTIPDRVVDEAGMDSFPASDPPSYTAPGRLCQPAR